MIDKNFYFENLSAFDILIDSDRKEAEKAIFKVYCILQRDKIWLNEVALPDEFSEEEAELLMDVEEKLSTLDMEYGFRFDDFYKLVQQEMRDQNIISDTDSEEDSDDGVFYDLEDDFFEEESDNHLNHLTDEELDIVTDFILNSAKTRFDYPQFRTSFPSLDEDFIDVNILMPIIVGEAVGDDPELTAAKMLSHFILAGFSVDRTGLVEIVKTMAKELGREVLAFKIASDSLQQGAHPEDVVQQISQIL